MISTPESGIDSILISYALLDPIMTIFRPLSAFLTATLAGCAENIFGKRFSKEKTSSIKQTDPCCNTCGDVEHAHSHGVLEKIKAALTYSFIELLGDLAKWFVVGFLLAGLVSVFIPETFFIRHLNNPLLMMLIMLGIGIPMYICASASTPIAAALILKGINPGATLVFLLAGPATNIASLTVLSKYLGRHFVLIYLLAIMLGALGLGYALDQIYALLHINPQATVGQIRSVMPASVKLVSTVILTLFTVMGIARKGVEHHDTC